MNFSILYTLYIWRAEHFLKKASIAEWDERGLLLMLGYEAQDLATELAHCIAMFGDQPLCDVNFSALRRSIEKMYWISGSPLCNGLDVARKALEHANGRD